MSTPVAVAGATALGYYVLLRQWQQCTGIAPRSPPPPSDTHVRTEQAPTTWAETLYLFKEALRYMYQETLGRWHAVDLFFGLAYISRRPPPTYPAADIAAVAVPISVSLGPHTVPDSGGIEGSCEEAALAPAAAQDLLGVLRIVRRYLLLCQGLKHHRQELQRKHWHDAGLGFTDADILAHSPTAGLLRPAYVIVRDTVSRQIILCIRGTHSRPDMFTSLTGAVKPHHLVTEQGVVLGYSHLGMLAAARWLLGQTRGALAQALARNPGYDFRIVGHSMGAGSATMLTMMIRDKVPELAPPECWAIACPACLTLDLAAACAPYVTALVHGTDIVPSFCSGAVDELRHEVMSSAWFADFRRDMQQALFGAVAGGVRGVSTNLATLGGSSARVCASTACTLLAPASQPFRHCYSGSAWRGTGRDVGNGAGGSAVEELDALLSAAATSSAQDRVGVPRRARRWQGSGWRMPGGLVNQEGDLLCGMEPPAEMVEAALQECFAAAAEVAQMRAEVAPDAAPLAELIDREPASSSAAAAAAAAINGSSMPGVCGGGGAAHRLAALGGGARPSAPAKKDDDLHAPPLPVSISQPAAAEDGGDVVLTSPAGGGLLRRRGWGWHAGAVAGDGNDRTGMVQWLLRGGGTVFQACRAQVIPEGGGWVRESPKAVGPGAMRGSTRIQDQGSSGDGGNDSSDEDPDLAPLLPERCSTGGCTRCGSAAASEAGSLEVAGDEGDGLLSGTAAMRSTTLGMLAAVSTDGASRVAEEEASVAESLLREQHAQGGSSSEVRSTAQQSSPPDSSGGSCCPSHSNGRGTDSATSTSTSMPSSSAARSSSTTYGGARQDAAKTAEWQARRQMYPAGRILHLLPSHVVRAAKRQQQRAVQQEPGGGSTGTGTKITTDAPSVPSGVGGDYMLCEVPVAQAYGRLRLCPTMVRDHFIPSYIRALDSVLSQLEEACRRGEVR